MDYENLCSQNRRSYVFRLGIVAPQGGGESSGQGFDPSQLYQFEMGFAGTTCKPHSLPAVN